MSGEWAKAQIARVQGPVYAAKAKAALKARKRAKFDGRAEYSSLRRIARRWAKHYRFCVDMEWEVPPRW